MDKKFKALQLRQTDRLLKQWRAEVLPPRPSQGWIAVIREALGMTAVALAKRLGMRSSSIHKFERSEIDETISLASLRKVAEAMGCELHYALVPQKPLQTMLHDRALEIAQRQILQTARTMALEEQGVPSDVLRQQIELLAQEILAGPRRNLWQDD